MNGIKIDIETNLMKEFRKFFNESSIKAKNFDNKSILLLYKLYKKEYIVFKRKFVI
jgi:50S ribosomal protein L16 3-hydroxylase